MPKPPDTTRYRRTAGGRTKVVLALAAVAALAGFHLWTRGGPAPADPPRRSLAEALGKAGRDVAESLRMPSPSSADPPQPGSVQASLLGTTPRDRNHMFRRTIADAGFACNEVRAAIAMLETGSAWRANCGETHVYLIEVGEFGRLTVVPILYNDTLGPIPIRDFPDEPEPTLQIREQ